MSKELWKEENELPSGTLFFGGNNRGRCIQLTKTERILNELTLEYEMRHCYITFSVKNINKLIKKLKEMKEV